MFVYFLQGKFFLDNGNDKYLQDKLVFCRVKYGNDTFFKTFLTLLFFEVLPNRKKIAAKKHSPCWVTLNT